MTIRVDRQPQRHTTGIDDGGPDVVASSRHECGCQVLSLDLERLADPHRELSGADRIDPIWTAIRRTLRIFPSPRHGNRRAVLSGIARQEIERHGLELLEKEGVVRIVDRRLERILSRIPADSVLTDEVVEFETGWSAPRRHDGHASSARSMLRLGRAALLGIAFIIVALALTRIESMLTTAGLTFAAMLPFIRPKRRPGRNISRPTPVFGSERVRVGRGWIETGSGRRRRSEEVLTTVMRESDSCDRVEVRIIGSSRVIRMRFDSVDDPRFVSFWERWAAYRSEAGSRRIVDSCN